jgi:hypothetical protein
MENREEREHPTQLAMAGTPDMAIRIVRVGQRGWFASLLIFHLNCVFGVNIK